MVVDTKNDGAERTLAINLERNRGPRVTLEDGGVCHPRCRATPEADGDCQPSCSVTLHATAEDPENDPLTYFWSGCATGNGPAATCTLTHLGPNTATVTVSDGRGGVTVATATAVGVNHPPSIVGGGDVPGGRGTLIVSYSDPDGDPEYCGWWGYCQCTGSSGSYNLECSLPYGSPSCIQRFACTDALGGHTEREFRMRP